MFLLSKSETLITLIDDFRFGLSRQVQIKDRVRIRNLFMALIYLYSLSLYESRSQINLYMMPPFYVFSNVLPLTTGTWRSGWKQLN